MSKNKMPEHEQIGSEINESSKNAEENPLAIEKFNNRLIFTSTPLDKSLLLSNSPEYQSIRALAGKINMKSKDMNFNEMQRLALGFVDEHFDVYRKKFSMPKEMVIFPIKCKDKNYYLSLNSRGYLCFYGNPVISDNFGISLYLVKNDDDSPAVKPN